MVGGILSAHVTGTGYRPHAAFLGLLRLVDDPRPPDLGAGAGPRDEPTEGQGCLGRLPDEMSSSAPFSIVNRVPYPAPAKDHSGAKAVARIHYRIVAHDGGWAYKLNDVFSEPFSSHAAALAAAKRVAAEQHVPGDTTHIEYQDEAGTWHSELSEADDRPDADVVA